MKKDKLRKFRISYYYLASGLEGTPDVFPEKIIEAETPDLAVYIYRLMFFNPLTLVSFESFSNRSKVCKYWGMDVVELMSNYDYNIKINYDEKR